MSLKLGVDINAMEPVGTAAEIEQSLKSTLAPATTKAQLTHSLEPGAGPSISITRKI